MHSTYKHIYIILLTFFSILHLHAADVDVELKKGWNQISVPFDHIKIDVLTANEEIEVIWAYQNNGYNLATRNFEYSDLAKKSAEYGILRGLSFGESIYILAKSD
ncbi:MAG: hypothetical protein DRG78_13230, partial [Epsilonproteobacteria bacterium]